MGVYNMDFQLNPKDVLFICDFETTGLDTRIDYPIEIGGIFTDSNLNILDTYSSFIYWDKLNHELIKKQIDSRNIEVEWPEKYTPAFKIHNITATEWLRGSKSSYVVAKQLQSKCYELKQKSGGDRKCIMLSDNSFFEHSFMSKLYNLNGMEFPFHYSTWDCNFIFEGYQLEKDCKQKKHRAMPDAKDVYDGLIEYKYLMLKQ